MVGGNTHGCVCRETEVGGQNLPSVYANRTQNRHCVIFPKAFTQGITSKRINFYLFLFLEESTLDSGGLHIHDRNRLNFKTTAMDMVLYFKKKYFICCFLISYLKFFHAVYFNNGPQSQWLLDERKRTSGCHFYFFL